MADKKRLERVEYTRAMNKAGYTILIPSMAPIHFAMLRYIFRSSGYTTTPATPPCWLLARCWTPSTAAGTI